VKHEYASEWKQVGQLASGVLRSVAEKRMKQAEFITAEKGAFEAAAQTAHTEGRMQLNLQLPAPAAALVRVSAGRH
jgi:hypothetical protein